MSLIGGSCHKYHFCRDKTFCRDKKGKKKKFVATNICHDKRFVTTKNIFVATSILLSRQKTCYVATNTCLWRQTFCRQKFRRDKIILVAAPANDKCHSSSHRGLEFCGQNKTAWRGQSWCHFCGLGQPTRRCGGLPLFVRGLVFSLGQAEGPVTVSGQTVLRGDGV